MGKPEVHSTFVPSQIRVYYLRNNARPVRGLGAYVVDTLRDVHVLSTKFI
jgi:hypothetical protein